MTFLLLDTMPILLIALPMTLVIVTGEIDLSVASIVGLSSVLLGVLTDAGWSVPAAGLTALVVGVALRCAQRLPRRVRRAAVAGGHHRHPGAVPRDRGRACWGPRPSRTSPDKWTNLATDEIGETGIPQVVVLFVVLAALFAVLLHFTTLRSRRVRHRAERRSCALHRRRCRAHQVRAVRPLRGGVGPGRHLLHAALRQRSRRQRDRAGAAGDRGGPPRRRLDLRWPREAARRHRRRAPHRRHLERAATRRRDGQRHDHHHRAAPRGLGGVHKRPGLGLEPTSRRKQSGASPTNAPVGVETKEGRS